MPFSSPLHLQGSLWDSTQGTQPITSSPQPKYSSFEGIATTSSEICFCTAPDPSASPGNKCKAVHGPTPLLMPALWSNVSPTFCIDTSVYKHIASATEASMEVLASNTQNRRKRHVTLTAGTAQSLISSSFLSPESSSLVFSSNSC